MRLAAIDNHFVSALDQACGEFFGEGFESAIASRNPARAEKGDPHLPRSYPRAALERAIEREDAFAFAGLLTGV